MALLLALFLQISASHLLLMFLLHLILGLNIDCLWILVFQNCCNTLLSCYKIPYHKESFQLLILCWFALHMIVFQIGIYVLRLKSFLDPLCILMLALTRLPSLHLLLHCILLVLCFSICLNMILVLGFFQICFLLRIT